MTTANDLYTTVKNPTANARTYGYLGPHGKRVLAGATYTFPGGIDVQMARGHGGRRRRIDALQRDLLAGLIEVIHTPAVLVQNANQDAQVANPTVVATGVTADGGALVAGFYKVAYTFVSLWGETTKGTSLSAEINPTDGTHDRITVTVPAPNGVTNCTAINIYVTARAASTGLVDATTLRKAGQVTGSTTTFNVDSVPAIDGTHPVPPTTNTTKAPTVFAVTADDATLGLSDPSWGRYTG